jgi:hypothetical protein
LPFSLVEFTILVARIDCLIPRSFLATNAHDLLDTKLTFDLTVVDFEQHTIQLTVNH